MNMWIEGLAALLLLVNVWLVGARSLWSYAFGIAAVALYAHIYFAARLYALAGLQGLFLALNIYGLVNWRQSLQRQGEVAVERMTAAQMAATAAAIAAMVAAIALLLRAGTDAASPWGDSLTTALSLAAQYWQARRRLESWALWALVNMATIGLCASQGMWITAATYLVLLALVLWGWLRWRRAGEMEI